MLAGCATAAPPAPITVAELPPPPPTPTYTPAVQITPPPLDPQRLVRPELMSRAMAALDIHHERLPLRDRMYLVDFQKFSGDARLYEVDLEGELVQGDRHPYFRVTGLKNHGQFQ